MKVVAINGSPKKDGNTYHALRLVLAELEKEGVETEIIHIGGRPVSGCMACGMCGKNKNEKCVLPEDGVNDALQKVKDADGVLLGTPVHYASIGGTMKSFMDRFSYVAGANGGMLRHKVGAAIVAVRRSGGMTAFDDLNHYINYSEMIIATSNYWNVIHGRAPGEVLQDVEGEQIMRVLGKNMAWLLKLVENGKGTVGEPGKEDKQFMNFIR